MSPKYGYEDRGEAARDAMARLRAGAVTMAEVQPNRTGGLQVPSNKILPLHFQETTPAVQTAQIGLQPYYTGLFYPNASVETVSVDGYAERGGAVESWDTIRAASGNLNNDSGGTLVPQVVSHANLNKWASIRRAFLLFYIGHRVDVDSTIVSAAVTVRPSGATADFGGSVVMCETSPASNTAVAGLDYQNVEDVALSEYIALSDIVSGTDVRFHLNAAGRAVIETQLADDGVAKLGIRLDWDLDNTEPTWVASKSDTVSFASADGTPDPELALVWSLGD